MRILLVGNYALDHQSSMLRYAELLRGQMTALGHAVEVMQPPAVFGGMARHRAVRKWLGYVDKYLLFPAKLRRRAAEFDLVHVCDHSNSMYLRDAAGRPASITCHDVLAIASAQGRFAEQRISATGKVQQRWILKGLAGAPDVVCVSANTARELAGLLLDGGAGQRMTVIPNALNYDWSPAGEASVAAMRGMLGLGEERYLLHIGGNHWYKNRLGTLRIFGLLAEELRRAERGCPRLVMAGEAWTEEMRELVRAQGLGERVVELVSPSNEDLRVLYTGAAGLLFPSLHEGFGWPLIEAQSCGCPVITSDRPPMNEVVGGAALLVDPAEEPEAAAAIAAGLETLPLLREAGLRNAARFDPVSVAAAYERFFTDVVEARMPLDGRTTPTE